MRSGQPFRLVPHLSIRGRPRPPSRTGDTDGCTRTAADPGRHRAAPAREGIARLTTREIAQAADAAEGSITKNFGGKLGLLTTLLSTDLPELTAWRDALTPPTPHRQDLKTALAGAADAAINYYAASLPLIAGAVSDATLFAAYRPTNTANGTGGPVGGPATHPTTAHPAVALVVAVDAFLDRFRDDPSTRATYAETLRRLRKTAGVTRYGGSMHPYGGRRLT